MLPSLYTDVRSIWMVLLTFQRPLYKTLATKYRVLIFSGDADACVPFTGSAEWTSELGFPTARDWEPWLAPISTADGVFERVWCS